MEDGISSLSFAHHIACEAGKRVVETFIVELVVRVSVGNRDEGKTKLM